MADLSGVLPVDKPAGPTSHDVVAGARRGLGVRRIGHTGTLDPFASGLLLVCIGRATRLAEYLTPLPKTYRAVMRLGIATDTDDLTGAPVRESDAWRGLDRHAVDAALARQVGTIEQVPPLYFAKKVGGERLYRAARRGETPERRAVRVTVHSIELLRVELPEVEFEVTCSSGTYIRAIARDVGEALATGGHLLALRRTASGHFDVADAVPPDAFSDADRIQAALVSPADAVRHLPRLTVAEGQVREVTSGRAIEAAAGPSSGPVALLSPAGVLLAIGEPRGRWIQPRKVLV